MKKAGRVGAVWGLLVSLVVLVVVACSPEPQVEGPVFEGDFVYVGEFGHRKAFTYQLGNGAECLILYYHWDGGAAAVACAK